MINFNQPETYEHIDFGHVDFPFGTYTIPDSITLPHWHTHTEIIYAKKGSVDVYINGTTYTCHEGDIQLIPGNSLHSIIPIKQATYIAIVVGDELFKCLTDDLHYSEIVIPLSDGSNLTPYHLSSSNPIHPYIVTNIKNIIKESRQKRPYKELFIKIEISQFFANLKRYNPAISTTSVSTSVSHTNNMKIAIEYLTNHYAEKITVKDMAHFMSMSEQHFSRLFKSYTGKTFVDYLTLFRLEQANKLLLNSDLPITQIPELTGFCNPNYFSRIYKKYYDHSPSMTRKHFNAN